MQVQDGMMYINNDRNEVMLFDKHGKFVRSTHSLLGQGPEDYTGAPSMYIDEKGTIGIYENFIPRIREYDKNLHLTRSYNVNVPDSTRSAMEWRCHAKLTDDVYIINDPKDFYFYSVKQEKVLETIHFDYPDLIGITSLFRLARYNGSLYYSHSYPCDTLYRVDSSSLSLQPAVVYDFGGESVDVSKIDRGMSADYYMNYLMQTKNIVVMDKFRLQDIDICYFLKDGFYIACQKKGGKVNVYKQGENCTLPVPTAVEGNKFYYAATPGKIDKYIDTKLMDMQDIQRLKLVNEDDNQVIICYELR